MKNIKTLRALAGSNMQNAFLVMGILLVCAVVGALRPTVFLTWDNINSMCLQISEVGLLTLGMMLAFLIGGIDLSVVSNAVLSATISGSVMLELADTSTGLAIAAAIVVALAVSIVCGFVNGLLIAQIKLPAILATLGTNSLFRGIATGLTGGSTLSGYPMAFSLISNGHIFGIYYAFLIFIVAAALISLYLNRLRGGFLASMTGSNEKAAYYSGVSTKRVIISVHTLVGLIAGVAGIVMMSRSNSINPDYGTSYLLQTILVCVVAGVNINGGRTRISGVALSLVLMQMISTSFNILLSQYTGANFFKNFAWGFLLLLIMVLNFYSGRVRTRQSGRLST